MSFLVFLSNDSRGHMTRAGKDGGFDIVPVDDSAEALQAFQSPAREAMANGGEGYLAKEHVTLERGLPGVRSVYDFVAIFPKVGDASK